MTLMFDTDVLVDLQREFPPAVAWFESLTEKPLIPGFVIMELIQRAANKSQVKRAMRAVKPFPVVWPAPADCHFALTNYASFHLSHNLGLVDSLIGACAVAAGAHLCTFNVKHFKAIPGLVTHQPYQKKASSGKTP